MPSLPDLQNFKKGISSITQWTGTEYKNMQKVFLGIISDAILDEPVRATCAVLDFIHLELYCSHSTVTLACMQDALDIFHMHKNVSLMKGCMITLQFKRYMPWSTMCPLFFFLGTADAYNTKLPESLHIDFAKLAYCASNSHNFIIHGTKQITQQEQLDAFDTYLSWCIKWAAHHVQEDDFNMEGLVEEEVQDKQDVVTQYHISKRSHFPHMSLSSLASQPCCGLFANFRSLHQTLHSSHKGQVDIPLMFWCIQMSYLQTVLPPTDWRDWAQRCDPSHPICLS